MIRILLTYVVPLIVPAVIYFLWLRFRGGAREREHPWPWLIGAGSPFMRAHGLAICAGILLTAIVLAGFALLSGTPDGIYEPAHLEDGKLVPGRFRPVQ